MKIPTSLLTCALVAFSATSHAATILSLSDSGTVNGASTVSNGAGSNAIAGYGGGSGTNLNRGVLVFNLTGAATELLASDVTFQLTYDIANLNGPSTTITLDYQFLGTYASGDVVGDHGNAATVVDTLLSAQPVVGTGFTTNEISVSTASLTEDFAVFRIAPGASPGAASQWSLGSNATLTVNAVPEPSTALLGALGALALLRRRR